MLPSGYEVRDLLRAADMSDRARWRLIAAGERDARQSQPGQALAFRRPAADATRKRSPAAALHRAA